MKNNRKIINLKRTNSMTKDGIAILLSTYNGENFISEQIESIISQTYENWILYIRDDGSTDNTLLIINKYIELKKNIILLNDSVKHRGAANGFMWLLNNVNADYYMFCDQDDVWLQNKIEVMIKQISNLEKINPCKPIIVHSDLIVVDSNMQVVSPSFWLYTRIICLVDNPLHFISNNVVTGCAMLFNNKCRKISLPATESMLMHDSWIALKTLKVGGLVFPIKEGLVKYRQHGNNTLGAMEYCSSLKYRVWNLKRSIFFNYKIYKMISEIFNISLYKYFRIKIVCFQTKKHSKRL